MFFSIDQQAPVSHCNCAHREQTNISLYIRVGHKHIGLYLDLNYDSHSNTYFATQPGRQLICECFGPLIIFAILL